MRRQRKIRRYFLTKFNQELKSGRSAEEATDKALESTAGFFDLDPEDLESILSRLIAFLLAWFLD